MDHASKALNQCNSSPFKDHDNRPYKMLSNHPEMKPAILKKNGHNKNPFGKVVSFRNIAGSSNREREAEQPAGFLKIIGRHRKMIEVFQQITDVAEYDYPVHIYGETGTGKELVAKAIHKTSSRKNGPFVPVIKPTSTFLSVTPFQVYCRMIST